MKLFKVLYSLLFCGVSLFYCSIVSAEMTLGNWTVINNLNIARSTNSAVLSKDTIVYTFGGYEYTSIPYPVEKSVILPNGTLSSWLTESSQMVYARGFGIGFATDSYVYALGASTFAASSTVERAPINPDGTLGTWEIIGTTPIMIHRASLVSYQNYVYVIGGYEARPEIYRTTVQADGSLSPWTLCTAQLNIGRHAHTSILIDTTIYVVSRAFISGITRTVEKAVVYPDGELSAFTVIGQTVASHGRGGLFYDGDYLNIIEGYVGGDTNHASERAKVLPDGNLGPWEPAPRLNVSRGGGGFVQTKYGAYSIGGVTSTEVTTVEFAPFLQTTDVRKEQWEGFD